MIQLVTRDGLQPVPISGTRSVTRWLFIVSERQKETPMHLIQYRYRGNSSFQLVSLSAEDERRYLADFHNQVNTPPSVRGWDSAVIRGGEKGLECSFGTWWPYRERSHEDRLSPIRRCATVHCFGWGRLVSILWEDPVRMLFTYPGERPEEGLVLSKGDIPAVEQAISSRMHLLVGGFSGERSKSGWN